MVLTRSSMESGTFGRPSGNRSNGLSGVYLIICSRVKENTCAKAAWHNARLVTRRINRFMDGSLSHGMIRCEMFVRLICWNADDAKDHARAVEEAGFRVD